MGTRPDPLVSKLTVGGQAASGIHREHPSQIIFTRAHQLADQLSPRAKAMLPTLQVWERFVPQAIQDFLDAVMVAVDGRLTTLEITGKRTHGLDVRLLQAETRAESLERTANRLNARLNEQADQIRELQASVRLLDGALKGTISIGSFEVPKGGL